MPSAAVKGTPTIWYQCDEGDADVASFFKHMTLGRARMAGSASPALSRFYPEHFAQVPTFTRNFFRSWFEELPRGLTLVLDNFQDVPAEAALPGVLPIIVEQIPEGATLIVISRESPTAAMGRLVANEQFMVIGTQQLQFTRAETQALIEHADAQQSLPHSVGLDELYAVTQGWAAGVTIMLRHAKLGPDALAARPLTSQQALFDYLAVEVFDRLDAEVRRFLLYTSCLDHITVPIARHVSGRPDAEAILHTLLRQNTFISYRPGPNSYYYHPLFRDFLRKSLAHSVTEAEQTDLLIRAARSLQETQDTETAIDLLLRARQWQPAIELILQIAPALVQQVKLTRLAGWLDALPPSFLDNLGWLSLWRGVQQITTDFAAAPATLEHAYRLFRADGETFGQMLACASIMQHFAYAYADCTPMLPWIDALHALLDERPVFPSLNVELQIHSGFLLAMAIVDARHPAFARTMVRVTQLLSMEVDITSRAAGLSALQYVYGGIGRVGTYGDLDEQIECVLSDPELGPAMRIHITWLHAWQRHLEGDSDRCQKLLAQGLAIARHHNLPTEGMQLLIGQLQSRGANGSYEATALEYSSLEVRARRMQPIAVAHFLYLRAMWELSVGNKSRALAYAEEALTMMQGRNWPPGESILWAGLAEIYCELGRFAEAEQSLARCAAYTAGMEAPLVEFNVNLIRAECKRRMGQEDEFKAHLAVALAIGRKQGFAHTYHADCVVLPRMIVHGLRLEIEVAYCLWFIAKRNLKPPDFEVPLWPWKARLRALGRLEIQVGDEVLAFSGKTQRKPLDLLALLCSHPEGLDTDRVMDILWPDLDGDAARNALDLATLRLRKMLRHKESVLSEQGWLRLNSDSTWVDVAAVERLGSTPFTGDPVAAVEQLLSLYRGSLLLGRETLAPILATRARLQSLFVRLVQDLAQKLDPSKPKGWETLTILYTGAIAREPAEEALYRAWIALLLAQGHEAEAHASFLECDRALQAFRGRKPSASTRNLLTRN